MNKKNSVVYRDLDWLHDTAGSSEERFQPWRKHSTQQKQSLASTISKVATRATKWHDIKKRKKSGELAVDKLIKEIRQLLPKKMSSTAKKTITRWIFGNFQPIMFSTNGSQKKGKSTISDVFQRKTVRRDFDRTRHPALSGIFCALQHC